MGSARVVIAVVFVLTALTGCASGPTFVEMEAQMPALRADTGRIYVLRDGTLGLAVQPDVRIDGVVVGTAKPNGFFYVDRPAGTCTITARTESEAKLVVSFSPGETKYVRFSIGFGIVVGRPHLDLMDASEGRSVLRDLHFAGAAGASPSPSR
jgi:hypothetical protein